MRKSLLWILMVVVLSLEAVLPWAALAMAFAIVGSWFFFPSVAGTLLLLLVCIVSALALIDTWKRPLNGVSQAGGQLFRRYRELS